MCSIQRFATFQAASFDNSTSMKVFFTALTAAAMSAANAADFCDQWGQAKSGNYIIYNNLWGSSAATGGGKQCTGLESGSGDTVSWHTTWSWQGGDKSVKSFANAALEFDPVPLTEVKSIPSTMSYEVKYSGNVVADVAYDLFTSSTAKGEKEFEIMIWLAAIGGAGPISSTGKAIDTTTIAGTEWSVYSGPNGQMLVYTFVASKQVEDFEGDLMEFFNYLTKSQKFKTSQYLIKVECGTEPFVGKDVSMTVSKYSATVNTGSGGATTPTQSGDSSSTGSQTTTAPSTSSTGSSTEQTPTTGSSTEKTPSTPTTGPSSEQTPATSSMGSSTEQTPSTGSSPEETPSSTGSSSEQTPATGSSTEETPASSPGDETQGSGDDPETQGSGDDPETQGSGDDPETWGTSDETTTSGSSDASTPTTSSSSEETPSTPSTGSSTDQQEATTAPTTSSSSEETPATGSNPKCTLRRRRVRD